MLQPGYQALVDLADIVKVDFLAVAGAERHRTTQALRSSRAVLLAEKVETHDDLAQAVDLGYTLFQGYFFCKPQVLRGREVPALKRNCLRFLYQMNQPALDYAQLERVIKEEVGLSYKLLRYLNSAAFGLRSKVSSIRNALALLGEKPLRKWASVVALAGMGDDKPLELALTCLIRARFCELLAPSLRLAGREADLFLLGLLSAVDALVDAPMAEVLMQMPVTQEVKSTLLGGDSPLGPAYALALACERGNWTSAVGVAGRHGISEAQLGEAHRRAIVWADEIVSFV